MASANSSDSNTTAPKSNSIAINVETGGVKDKFVIHSVYGKEQKMQQILSKITDYLNQKYDPVKYEIDGYISSESFTGFELPSSIENKSITEYDRNEIKNKGLSVYVKVPQYNHQVR
eukprot:257210_1